MKLLIFTPYYPPHLGGLELHAQEFSACLSGRGLSSVIVTSHIPATSPVREKPDPGLTIYRLPAKEIIPAYPILKTWQPTSQKIVAALSKEKFDLVISRTRFFTTSLLACQYAKKYRRPYVHIEHGSGFIHLHNPIHQALGRLYDLTFGRYVLSQAQAIVANSLASAAFVKRLCPAAQPTVIYRGVNQALIKKTAPAKPKYAAGKLHLAFAGRLIDGKGIPDLLHVIKSIDTGSLCCTIIGHGPQRAALRKLIQRLGLEQVVRLVGLKNQTDTIALLKSADIFVHPSYTEGLPSSVIEAALCECAIIATNVGGTKEIIAHGQSGLLIPPHNQPALRQALLRLIGNAQERQKFGQAANAQATRTFNWDKAADQYLALFKSL